MIWGGYDDMGWVGGYDGTMIWGGWIWSGYDDLGWV